MGKLRLGVIGAGAWTVTSHLPNFAKRRDEVEFVAVCRKGTDLLADVQREWGFTFASEDYRDVLDAGVDICLVASPPGLHHEHALSALEAGAHVLLEKPMTIAPADAWDLVRAAERLERHLVLSFGWNYMPMLRTAKEIMAEPGIGTIEQLALRMSSPTRELLANAGSYPHALPGTVPDPATWTDPTLSGGGYAQAQLTHALGVVLWLTGLEADTAFAFMSAPMSAPVELHDAVALRFRGGAVGTMAGGSSHAGAGGNKHSVELQVIGSEGQCLLDLERETLWLFRPDQGDIRPELGPDAGLYNCDGPPNALIDLALGLPVENCSPGWLGARTVDVLDACYRSARQGQPVAVGGAQEA